MTTKTKDSEEQRLILSEEKSPPSHLWVASINFLKLTSAAFCWFIPVTQIEGSDTDPVYKWLVGGCLAAFSAMIGLVFTVFMLQASREKILKDPSINKYELAQLILSVTLADLFWNPIAESKLNIGAQIGLFWLESFGFCIFQAILNERTCFNQQGWTPNGEFQIVLWLFYICFKLFPDALGVGDEINLELLATCFLIVTPGFAYQLLKMALAGNTAQKCLTSTFELPAAWAITYVSKSSLQANDSGSSLQIPGDGDETENMPQPAL